MTASTTTAARLNRLFLETKAAEVAGSLTVDDDSKRFYDVLRAMGATDADFNQDPLIDLLVFQPASGQHCPNETNSARWPDKSPLSAMGYKVGDKGLPQSKRHEILRVAFMNALPLIGTDEYMAEWGEAGTAARLKKIANYLASNCQNMKRKTSRIGKAIQEWEEDLEWLKRSFFKEHFNFPWPNTIV